MADIAFLAERMRLGFGADLVVDRLATGLVERGHRVTVYASLEDGTYAGSPYQLVLLSFPSGRFAPFSDYRARRVARGVELASVPHDLFFVITPPLFSLLPVFRDRGVAIDCGVSDSTGMPLAARANFAYIEHAQNRWYFRHATRIITISSWLRGQLPEALRPRTTPIPLGADHYEPATGGEANAMRRRLGIAGDEVMVLYVGRLNHRDQPYKGTAELLRTCSRVRERTPARLVMAGFGREADAEWARAGGATPLINVPVEDMPSLFAAADVYATASKWEGFDLPLVEAQRAGTPVVAYRRGAHSEVVDAGSSGVLVDDELEFVTALEQLVIQRDRRVAMGDRARDWAARFRWADAVSAYDDVIGELVERVHA